MLARAALRNGFRPSATVPVAAAQTRDERLAGADLANGEARTSGSPRTALITDRVEDRLAAPRPVLEDRNPGVDRAERRPGDEQLALLQQREEVSAWRPMIACSVSVIVSAKRSRGACRK